MTDQPEASRGFAGWLADQRIRRAVFIAGLFPLPGLSLISAAVIVMAAQLNGPREALVDCLLAVALLTGMAWLSGADIALFVQSAIVSWSIWLIFGGLLWRTGSVGLALQVAVLFALAALLAFNLAIGDPVAFWTDVLDKVYADLQSDGLVIDADTAAQAPLMGGFVVAGTLVGVMVALLLGSKWAFGLTGRDFGTQFRSLRLGYVIGGLAAVTGVAAVAGFGLNGELLVFGAAFVFQGIAVLAWWGKRLRWPGYWWVGLWLPALLWLDLLIVEAALLSAVGFVDNWYDLRRQKASGLN